MGSWLEMLQPFIPLMIPIVVLVMKKVVNRLPSKHIPWIVGVLGLAHGALTGQADAQLIDVVTNSVNSATVGLAGVGVHQIAKQVKKPKQ